MSKKAELLEAIAGKNRGLLANEIDNVRVLSAIQQLEDTNPTRKPLEAKELLQGDWRLLYTTSKGILGLDRFPLFKLGQIYQCIRVSEAKVYNIAEIVGLPMLEGLVSVAATFEPISERRVSVVFERSIIGLQRFFSYNTPKKFIQQIESGKKFLPLDFKIDRGEQKGWLDITYLDEDMRIGRGNEGNVFVLTKEATPA
ncbi:PAP/fibrillin family protein [Waterburya agarophytonicola K14]|uniref:PAP/fibrillin family protein n=1 Tax=Waterburya agarophytonicola KI4 TaxID=2874699 RepID=A0A964FHX9_9CYAN|nr:PAP/fibrillin family protein [Waterburya agarophytonicola]MCC0179471.1 PAP/fibrillin family protein [Waterburya agarophytonicola KI4]